MRKAIAISFLFTFLVTATVFGQMLRLPTLVHHYLEHVKWDGNYSIIEFIAVHYSYEINHPDDQHGDHGKLPFKSMENSASQVVSTPPQLFITLVKIFPATAESITYTYHQEDFSNSYLDSIWQPPKFS